MYILNCILKQPQQNHDGSANILSYLIFWATFFYFRVTVFMNESNALYTILCISVLTYYLQDACQRFVYVHKVPDLFHKYIFMKTIKMSGNDLIKLQSMRSYHARMS